MFEMFAKRTPDPEEYLLYIVFVQCACNLQSLNHNMSYILQLETQEQ